MLSLKIWEFYKSGDHMKLCKACNPPRYKPLSDFYVNKSSKDGHQSNCKECEKAKYRKYYAENPKRRKVYIQKWSEQNPDRLLQHSATKRKKDLIQIKARKILNNEIRSGRIQRLPCEVCGDLKSQAHHHDYSKPLEVTFLCQLHHIEAHKKEITNLPEEPAA